MISGRPQKASRIEKDLLGEVELSSDIFYGIQTWRASGNFKLSGTTLSHFPHLVNALAMVKMATARINKRHKILANRKCEVIERACQMLLQGHYHSQFVVDMIQGGAGTSTNMNTNEVIANIGLQLLGCPLGKYEFLHPNNDVNMSQSTNDVYPTAIRLAILLSTQELLDQLSALRLSLAAKAEEFSDVLKMGRTQLQDAVPMTLGQEFHSWDTTLGEDFDRINDNLKLLLEVNLGGTAIGTGINAPSAFGQDAIRELGKISGFKFVQAKDLIEASSDMGAFVLFSGLLKRLAIKLSKICNDLRLLSMGPRAGLNEINLPPVQLGSSIMPGKINPVIPEAVSQVGYQIMGNDLAISVAAESGQLQLNAMEPLIAYNMLDSIRLLNQAIPMLDQRCIQGITVNQEVCRSQVENSIGIVTALNPKLGYETASKIAQQALRENRSVIDVVKANALLSDHEIQQLLKPENMINPGSVSAI